jgi:hypothetical protein
LDTLGQWVVDVIGEWLAECIVRDSAARIKQSDLYKSYAEYVNALGGVVGNSHIGPELIKRGLDLRKSGGARYFYGCRLRTSKDIDQNSCWEVMSPERKVRLDVIDEWFADCIVRDSASRIKQSDLYKSYAEYVNALGGVVGNSRIGPELIKRGLKQRKSNGVRYFSGCRLRCPVDIGE